MPQAQGYSLIPITDLKDFRFLVQAALTRLQCRITGGLQGRYQQITANSTEVYPGRNNWRLEYNIIIDYKQEPAGIGCTLTVSDERNTWALPFCQKRLKLIQSTLTELGQREAAPIEASTLYGEAHWATEAELDAKGYLEDHLEHTKLLLAPWGDNRVLSVPARHNNTP